MTDIPQDTGAQERDHTTKLPQITRKELRPLLVHLIERFPQAFVRDDDLRRPLKLGIHFDLSARCPALSARERRAVLHYYVNSLTYLRACVVGAARIDLDGNVCGEVTAAEAQHAVRLATILVACARKQKLIKSRAAKPGAPRKEKKPSEEKLPAPQRDGLAALREAGAKRRAVA
jgi:ProP effector